MERVARVLSPRDDLLENTKASLGGTFPSGGFGSIGCIMGNFKFLEKSRLFDHISISTFVFRILHFEFFLYDIEITLYIDASISYLPTSCLIRSTWRSIFSRPSGYERSRYE